MSQPSTFTAIWKQRQPLFSRCFTFSVPFQLNIHGCFSGPKWQWIKNRCPSNGTWKHGLKPAVFCWFNLDPYPNGDFPFPEASRPSPSRGSGSVGSNDPSPKEARKAAMSCRRRSRRPKFAREPIRTEDLSCAIIEPLGLVSNSVV